MEKYLDKIVLIKFKRKFRFYELEAYVYDIKDDKYYLIYKDEKSSIFKFEIINLKNVIDIIIVRHTNNSLEFGFYNIEAYHDYVILEKKLGYKMSAIDKDLMYQYEKQLYDSSCSQLDIPLSTLRKL